jgi:tetratricopeptide (TPR) repeat protein
MVTSISTTSRTRAFSTSLLAGAFGFGMSVVTAFAHQQDHGDHAPVPHDAEVPLFEGLGDHQFPVTTGSETAQAYFDQGLTFVYGFNHFEAVRSFEMAVRHDEGCAMCYWGVALAHGPHINAPMMPEAVGPAYEALERALALAPEASEREQAYIEALSHRYEADPPEDRSDLDRAYADAMRGLVAQYPDDLDAATLFAEALMNQVPWDYWTEDGQPRAETAELVGVLEAVIKRDPDHAGANHLYIHAMEDSPEPGRAEEAADRLAAANIQIGHMIHMPSHIYARIGRWHDASRANEAAIIDDRSYLAAHEVEGLVPLLYHPHNVHFLSWTAGMEGRGALAYEAASELAAATPRDLAPALPFLNSFLSMPTLTLVRFERWDEILALSEPEGDNLWESAVWHYARGLAFAAQGQVNEASQEAARLDEIANSEEAGALEAPEAFFPGASMISVANLVLQGELALKRGHGDEAISLLEEAVARQDALPYFEPPHWFTSARLNLGRMLLDLDRPQEAEAVYRADLMEYPNNGWALFGLAESLRAQGNVEEAQEVTRRFEEAWQHADVTLSLEPRSR